MDAPIQVSPDELAAPEPIKVSPEDLGPQPIKVSADDLAGAGPISKAGFKQAFSDLTNLPALTAGGYSALTGGLGFIGGGLARGAGSFENFISELFGRTPQRDPAAMQRAVQEGVTYRGSPAAERVASAAALPFEAWHKVGETVGQMAEASGERQMQENPLAWRAQIASNPAVLAALQTAVEAPGYMYGPKALDAVARKGVEATIKPKAARAAPEETAWEAAPEPTPPVTQTSSGVPLPLDKLIAQAEYIGRGEIPEAPKPRQLVRETAKTGLEARKPALPEAEFAPGGAETRPRPGPGLPEPPAAEAPKPTQAAQPRDFFLEESPYRMDVNDSEVRGGREYSGGEGRRMYQTLHFTEPFEVVLAGAGRELARAEMKGEAPDPRPLSELTNFAAQLPAESPFAELRGATKDRLSIAASQYWDQLRGDMLKARQANPEKTRIQLEASPAETMTIYGEEPAPPRGLPPLPEPLTPAGELGLPPTPTGLGTYIGTSDRKAVARTPEKGPPGLVYAIKQLGGIKPAEAPDIGGERGFRASEGAGRGLFRKEGLGMDDLATQLKDKGYAIDTGDVDGGVQQLRDMIRDELEGKKKHYPGQSEEAGFEAMRDKAGKGPGTLSANPMFDPEQIKASARFIGKALGVERARGTVNAIQAMPDSAAEGVGHVLFYADAVRAAAERAVIDRINAKKHGADMIAMLTKEYQPVIAEARKVSPKYVPKQPTTVLEAISEIEKARREIAKMKMQRAGYEAGVFVKAREGTNWKEFERSDLPASTRDLIGPDGELLRIRKDAKPAIEQILAAHDIGAQRKWSGGFGGGVEALSHGLVRLPMINPMFHTVTTGGKAAAYIPFGKNRQSILNPDVLKKAYETVNDREVLNDQMGRGLQPWSARMNMEQLGSVPGKVEAALKGAGFEKGYEAWSFIHQKLLGNMVNFMQQAFVHMRVGEQMAEAKAAGKTVSPEMKDMFERAAFRDSNLIGGNLPKHDLAQWLYRAAGIAEFSRGLSTSTTKQMSRAISGDKVLYAYARAKGFTLTEAKTIMEGNRDFMRTSLALDYFMMMATANLINYVATSYYDDEGKFVYQNPGAKPSELLFPRTIRVKPEVDEQGKRTGRWITIGSVIRNTRDMLELALLPFEYALGVGEKPKILGYKASIPVQVGQEWTSRKDWAGRELSGFPEMAASAAGHVMPPPLGNLPMVGLEAVRMNSTTFFEDSIKRMFEPTSAMLTLAGTQPHLSAIDPEVNLASHQQKDEERKLGSRAMRLKEMLNSADMSPESRQAAIASIIEDARKVHMDAKQIEALARYLSTEGPGRSQQRAAGRYKAGQAEGQLSEPPQ
jgi:hypothetical protein